MSILINMEMPKSCSDCPMLDWDLDYIKCKVTGRHFKVKEEPFGARRVDDCPLVPAPPHGRLIDADELIVMEFGGISFVPKEFIDNAPTIIEADPTQSNAPNTLDALTNTCPLCGGTLSEIRTDGTKRWRHCYSCHMEQEETT